MSRYSEAVGIPGEGADLAGFKERRRSYPVLLFRIYGTP
jgi:hypothetical protein